MNQLATVTDPNMDKAVNAVLALWDMPAGSTARLINLSENHTYLVEAPGYRSILRVHRNGNHTRKAIEAEIAWTDALRNDGALLTPRALPGRDGEPVQDVRLNDIGSRFLVLFEFVAGTSPSETSSLVSSFEQLGKLAAQAHLQAIGWQRPENFQRMSWNLETMLGVQGHWGDWRDAPNVTPHVRDVLERVEARVRIELTSLGQGPTDYGLIHADMRLANLLVEGDTTWVIDFDDAGFGWFLYDFASAISFLEDDLNLPAWKAAWMLGYRQVRALPDDAEHLIDTFIMLRRLALLAWIGSRIESPEPQALAPNFARVSATLGESYLSAFPDQPGLEKGAVT